MFAYQLPDDDLSAVRFAHHTHAHYWRLYADAPEPLRIVYPNEPLAARVLAMVSAWPNTRTPVGIEYERPASVPAVVIPATAFVLPAKCPRIVTDDDWDEQSPAAKFHGIKRTVLARVSTVLRQQDFVLSAEDSAAGLVRVDLLTDAPLTGPQAHAIRRAGVVITYISEGRHVFVATIGAPVESPKPTKTAPVSPPLPVDAPAVKTPTGKRQHNEDAPPTPLPLVNNTPRIFALGLQSGNGKHWLRIGGSFRLWWMLELSGALASVPGFVGFSGDGERVYVEAVGGSLIEGAHRVREFISVWKPTERDLQRWEHVIGDDHAPERAPYEYIRRENDETDTMGYRS